MSTTSMPFSPLLKFHSTTIMRAFILNSLVLAIITVISIEFRSKLDDFSRTKNLTEFQKVTINFIGTFLTAFLAFLSLRLLLGFGDGYLASIPLYKYLF